MNVGACGCQVGTLRRSHMQGLMVDEILRAGFKNDSHWSTKYRSRSVDQCESKLGHRGVAICKV